KTEFSIVLPQGCSKALREAAETLQNVFERMTGTALPIISENQADPTAHNFCIDTAMGTARPDDGELFDGYRIVIGDKDISVCGASQAGSRNGVYGFIEDFLGCMFLTPDDTFIPENKTVCLEKNDRVFKPATRWRDVYAYETVQDNWAAKIRLNGIDIESDNPELSIEELQYEGWGTWCHDCYDYLSPDDYFAEHPEYFSEKDGVRVTSYDNREAYLCLSNPEVFEIVKNSLAKKIEENPDVMYWDFSGNDNPSLAGCQCEACKAADKAAGGTGMGTLLPFLNKLAKAFPDKYISTLAYLHTLKAPKNIKAEPNVVIKLCSMPGDQASSYLDGANANSAEFKAQVEEWSKITDKIVVWDYVVNFAHLLMPFPNFAVQAKNQQFYEENNIIGVFHQASREKGGEFACLRSYVLSRRMWEGSGADVAKCVSKYVAAYYGEAAPKVIEYMNLCASELCASGKKLGLYDGLMPHYSGYLSENNVKKYKELISEAKAAVAGNSELESRIEAIELSVEYAAVLLPEISDAERKAALAKINELCEKHGITMVCEWNSLENFNKTDLEATIAGEKKDIKKPYIIGASVAGAAALAAAAGAVVYKIIKKKKHGKD
ncbi:MAG: DUF4838 domain-containing protein, partial [Clostridiaceae bacterium]|nr:DUF4838 domain-containing protein [Clostridiaceae bacterium]